VDKILPIDSIYTIGTFNELVERILMPALIMNFERAKNTIELEAWPFFVDILLDTEKKLFDKQAIHWLYHMYDNNIRIFTHSSEEAKPESDNPDESHEQAENDYISFEINVDPADFEEFFESSGTFFSQVVFEEFESYMQEQDEEKKAEKLKAIHKNIYSVNQK
jgi:hypothetical protein